MATEAGVLGLWPGGAGPHGADPGEIRARGWAEMDVNPGVQPFLGKSMGFLQSMVLNALGEHEIPFLG